MSYSPVTYTGDGVTTDFAIPFQYLSQDEVVVTVDDAAASYSFTSESIIQFDTAPADGSIIFIERDTNDDERDVVWSNGVALTARQLNLAINQLFYLMQESKSVAARTIHRNYTGDYTADGRKIINVADPESDQDAATKYYVDTLRADMLSETSTAVLAKEDAEAAAAAAATLASQVTDDRAIVEAAVASVALATFSTRAEAASASIGTQITHIRAGNLLYKEDPTGTALTTLDGRKWSPAGNRLFLQHWMDNDVPGTTDMRPAMLSAVAYAATLGTQCVISGNGETIAMSSQVYVSAPENVLFEDMTLTPLGETVWASHDGYPGPMLLVTGDYTRFGSGFRMELRHICSGLLFSTPVASGHDVGIYIHGWASGGYGIRTKASASQFRSNNLVACQYEWGETGFDDQANRVGYGLKIETADCMINNPIVYYTGYPIHKSGPGSWQIVNAHPFNGAMTVITDPDAIYTLYIEEPNNGTIIGGYYDQGTVFINADNLHNGTDTLQIVNAWFPYVGSAGSNTDSLRIHTSVADNNLRGLTLNGTRFTPRANSIRFTTEGSGSFTDPKQWSCFAVQDADGGIPSNMTTLFQLGQYFGLSWDGTTAKMKFDVSGTASIQAKQIIEFDTDYDANSGTVAGYSFKIKGVEHHSVNYLGQWFLFDGFASGGGAVGGIYYSGNALYIAPSKSDGTGLDYTNRLISVPGTGWSTDLALAVGGKLTVGSTISAKYIVEAHTEGSGSPHILYASESLKVLTNEGAAALNYHTLPSASAGQSFTFVVQNTYGIHISAAPGDTIRVGTAVSTTSGSLSSSSVGNSITLVAINDTEWVATSVIGTWTPS